MLLEVGATFTKTGEKDRLRTQITNQFLIGTQHPFYQQVRVEQSVCYGVHPWWQLQTFVLEARQMAEPWARSPRRRVESQLYYLDAFLGHVTHLPDPSAHVSETQGHDTLDLLQEANTYLKKKCSPNFRIEQWRNFMLSGLIFLNLQVFDTWKTTGMGNSDFQKKHTQFRTMWIQRK